MPLLSSTVITPSLPTFSITSAIRSPISLSAAEMAATCAMSARSRTGLARLFELGHDRLGALVQAALEQQRVGAGGDDLQALGDDRLGQHGGGGGAIADHVVGLRGDLDQQARAHVLEGVLELDLLGDRDAVVGDRGGAELLVDRHVAAARAERGLDRLGDGVHAALERAPCFLIKIQLLSHIYANPPLHILCEIYKCKA